VNCEHTEAGGSNKAIATQTDSMKKTILLIEDDRADIEHIEQAFKQNKIRCKLCIAHSGSDALEMLTGEENRVAPDLILLDLDLPKMSGLEFLRIINNYVRFKKIETYLLTSRQEEYDPIFTKRFGIAGYIVKPLLFETGMTGDTKKLFHFLSGNKS
jgi:CheY-like chemotaxis protein